MTAAVSALPAVPPPAAGITYRLMRDLDDIPGMAAANDANRRYTGILEPTEPGEMRRHYERLINSVYTRDVVVAEADGRIVGYVRTSWRDHISGARAYEVTLLVDPGAWGRGIATTLLAWAAEHHRALVTADPATHPADQPRFLEAFLFDGDEELRTALLAGGFRAVRRGAEMLRDRLDDELPEVPLPDGFEVRAVAPADLRRVWEAAVGMFRESFGEGVQTDQDWERFRSDPRLDLSLMVVAYAGDEIAGYVHNVLEPKPDGTTRGLLGGVATAAPYRRRGLARALVARSLHLLRERGATDAYLGVDLENPNQALTLYESCGFRVASGGYVYHRTLDRRWPEEAS
jgi:ribosomal protein S18 acetylase RimI-like enzyme